MGILFNVFKVVRAKGIASRAVKVFTSTVEKLQKSNDMLNAVIETELTEIEKRQATIDQASKSIDQNRVMIDKLKSFCF